MSKRRHTKSRRDLKWLWIGLGAVAFIAAAILILRPRAGLPLEVQPAQAHALIQQGAMVVDVRTQAEWLQGHVAGSVLIPLDELQGRLNELPRDRDIVVVCRSGARSQEGGAILRAAGFTRVTCLAGGLQAWVAAGYPLEQ